MMLGNAPGWIKIVHFGESINLLFLGSDPIASSYRIAGRALVVNNQIACYIERKICLH